MSNNLMQLIDRFASLRVLVLGDAMLDSYLEGTAIRLCAEAPVPVVRLTGRRDAPGGAANTAANARSLGAAVSLLSVVGDDTEAMILRRALANRGVDDTHIYVLSTRRTLAKHRVCADTHTLVRFDQGDTAPISGAAEAAVIERLKELFPQHDAVIVSDYDYGMITPRMISTLGWLQHRWPRTLVVDSKRLRAYGSVGITACKPNYEEALRLLDAHGADQPEQRTSYIAAQGERLLQITGARIAAVTLDADGGLIFEHRCPPYRTYTTPTSNSRAAGAGDTFVSALTLALAAEADTPAAAELAAAAAEVVVSRDGTTACAADELRIALTAETKYIADTGALQVYVEHYRHQGRQIVFSNGCFDILHRGHITYINHAKALGDVLILGVNSDASIRRLKGPERPINRFEDRVLVLAALSSVDHVVAFEEDTPENLIRLVRPDVFVKGGDYTRETLPEASLVEQLGGVVQILPFLPDSSTTRIIERLRAVQRHTPAPVTRTVASDA